MRVQKQFPFWNFLVPAEDLFQCCQIKYEEYEKGPIPNKKNQPFMG